MNSWALLPVARCLQKLHACPWRGSGAGSRGLIPGGAVPEGGNNRQGAFAMNILILAAAGANNALAWAIRRSKCDRLFVASNAGMEPLARPLAALNILSGRCDRLCGKMPSIWW